MYQSDIDQFLKEHSQGKDGYKSRQVREVKKTVDNGYGRAITVTEQHIIFTAHDGQVIEIVDDNPASTAEEQKANVDAGRARYEESGSYSPNYRVVNQGDPDNTDSRSPERKRLDEVERDEANWNYANGPVPHPDAPGYNPQDAGRGSGYFETHLARKKREDDEKQAADRREAEASRRRIEEANQQNRSKELEIQGAQANEASRHNKAAEDLQSQQVGIQQGQLDVQRAQEERENRTPRIVGNPTDTTKTLTYIDPRTGEIKSMDNPAFNAIKEASERKREELRLAIEQNKMTAEIAAAEYKRWYDVNVAAPLALAAERRAQAEEQRQALQAEEQRKQEEARNAIARAQVGQQAASTMVQAEQSLLPYRVGGTFAGNFSDAINGLAHGGKLDSDASSGVHFQASDFQFQAPNFSKIAQRATADALKHLTPYRPSDTAYATADYTGIPTPTAETLQTAPAAPTYIDTATGVNQLINPPAQ